MCDTVETGSFVRDSFAREFRSTVASKKLGTRPCSKALDEPVTERGVRSLLGKRYGPCHKFLEDL